MKLITPKDFEIEYAPFWNKDIVIIGRGKEAGTFKYKEDVPVFAINTAVEFYPNPWYIVMLEAHFKELKDIPIIQNHNIIFIKKSEMREMKLAYGCTPSIFISYMLKKMNKGTTIYLQGFSMDEERNLKYPSNAHRKCNNYDWNRQIQGFQKCQSLAKINNIELILIDKNDKISFIKNENPKKEMLNVI
jgi:hypothetical protein